MTLSRIFTFAIADEAGQDQAIATFNGLKDSCKKDGAPYIVTTHASKVKVLKDTSGGANWTVFASITFQSEADADYFAHQDPVNQEVKNKNKGISSSFCVLQGTFS
ncbi:hypothetical protein F5Y12DRAFT_463561 [Xylaria sp. FL1777]|nr:hypothetical protein F5Y12DRAFT_463561 [Xylaria sp. FL1777]